MIARVTRRLGRLIGAAAIVLAVWPWPLAGPAGDPAVVVPSVPPAGPSSLPSPASEPVFAEECSGTLRAEWHALTVPGDPGFGLDSDFLGDLRQVSIADGLCTITARRMQTPSGRPYASAAMSTKDAFAQRYGIFEIRVRYPAGQGMWPAFWLLEQREAISTPPEIDVFEAYPGESEGRRPNLVGSTLHYAGGSHHFVHDYGSDLTTDFHVHRMTWSPGLLVFTLDGVETGRITSDIPDVAMYPIVNLALGAPGFRVNEGTPDVATMDIDYIRVWAT